MCCRIRDFYGQKIFLLKKMFGLWRRVLNVNCGVGFNSISTLFCFFLLFFSPLFLLKYAALHKYLHYTIFKHMKHKLLKENMVNLLLWKSQHAQQKIFFRDSYFVTQFYSITVKHFSDSITKVVSYSPVTEQLCDNLCFVSEMVVKCDN